MYIKVENGQTVGRPMRKLPQVYNFANGDKTGNFDLLDTATHIAEGFYPLIENNATYDRRIERLNGYTDQINALDVTRTRTKEDIPLDVLKANKCKEIERHEASLLKNSLFQYDSKIWKLTQETAQNVDGLQTAMSLPGATFPSPFSWTDADGNEVAMDQAAFQAFAGAVLTSKLTIAGASKTHVGTVKAQTDPLTVATYDYSAGWGNYVPPVENEVI